jgi:glyoxylase-like metal-dependent hydrolase (beta-lactamase superfamily II)
MKLFTIPVGPIATNCYILASGAGSCVVIDPGAQPDKIIALMHDNNLAPAHILLTHGHHDHIGGVKQLLERFEGLTVSIGAEDLEMLEDTQKSMAAFRSNDDTQFVVSNAVALRDGDVVEADGLSLRVVETPGHTKGSVCYVIGNMMFSGDTLFREEIGRCDLYGGSYPTMKRSLAKLCALEGDFSVYPGHGEGTTLEHERKYNPYILEPMPSE